MNLASVLLLLAACHLSVSVNGQEHKEAIELSMANHDHVLGSAQVSELNVTKLNTSFQFSIYAKLFW